MAADVELAMFIAAMLPADRGDEKIGHLLNHGPVGQARYLRLIPESARRPEAEDAISFGRVVEVLSGSAAECIVTEAWTAWRTAKESTAQAPDAIERWLADGEVNFLKGNAFASRSPVDVAVIEALARFKDHALRQEPDEERFERLSESELRRLRHRPRAELDDLIVQAVLDWRSEWRALASSLGVSTLPETVIGDGDPQITAIKERPDPRVRIKWGGMPGVTWVEPDPDGRHWDYLPLSTFLDPGRTARIYHDLVERAERAIGCPFGSQAWSRPELVAAWAW
jgi:hypothetical protein